MKQKCDELRTLAIKLFEAGQIQKRKQPEEIWGENRNLKFRDLSSESVAVWDTIALAAIKHVRKRR